MAEIRFPCWDPVLLDLPGPFDLRWYGLMYVVAFLVGHHIMVRQARSGFFPLTPQRVGDLIFLLIFGVILGGRLGYVFFYPKEGLWENPLAILKVWEGGLSFHGGLIGVSLAAIWFARKNKLSILHLCDCCALAVTPGIFFVRMANFINSELWGRTTDDSVSWAMRCPRDPDAMKAMHMNELPGRDIRSIELAIQYAFDRTQAAWKVLMDHVGSAHADTMERLREFLDWEKAMPSVPLRHPSQLYEGLAEGVLLGLVLWFVYWRTRGKVSPGTFGGIFLLGYGTFRFFIEFFREPDEHMGFMFNLMTMGQILCCAMLVAGVWMIFAARGAPVAAEGTEGKSS